MLVISASVLAQDADFEPVHPDDLIVTLPDDRKLSALAVPPTPTPASRPTHTHAKAS